MLDPLSLNEKEDAEWISILNNVTYFNLEASVEYSSLVFNASKQGIDAFLKKYGEFKIPPPTLSFEDLQRPARRWLSPEVILNEHPEISDPTPYKIRGLNSYRWNHLTSQLQIEFIAKEGAQILCAGIRDGVALLILNQQGWKTFLALLQHLRDTSYWFFVTAPNPAYRGRPFFQLTTPYVGHSEDRVFKALEFIRLEPSEEIYLDIIPNCQIFGNSSGFLLFSKWLHDFAFSNEKTRDSFNGWNKLPKALSNEEDTETPLQWISLCKTKEDSPYPLFSFERKEGEHHRLYVFGNSKGFQEIFEIIEEYAFYSDHDEFYCRSLERRLRGDLAQEALGPIGFYQQGLMLFGGGLFTPKYNPSRFTGTPANLSPYDTTHELAKNFVNDRIIFQ